MNLWRFRMLYRIAERRPRHVSLLRNLTFLASILKAGGLLWAAVWRLGVEAVSRRG